MPVSEGMLHGASMMRGSLPVAHSQASMGNRVGNMSNYRGGASNQHFFSRNGAAAGRSYNMTGNARGTTESFGARSNSMPTGRTETGPAGAGRSTNNWQRYSTGNQAGRSPEAGNGARSGWQGGSSPAARGNQYNWQRFASPSPYSGRTGSGQSAQRGGWQGYSSQPRSYSGGGSYGRPGGSYSGSRPLDLNRSIMGQRAPSSGYYGGGRGYSAPSGGNYGGGRGYSAPSGGNRSYPAPRGGGGGGGHSYSAPKSSGGGGGGGHVSGGGGHSGGGGGHGGGRH
jgi:hypothetical protein